MMPLGRVSDVDANDDNCVCMAVNSTDEWGDISTDKIDKMEPAESWRKQTPRNPSFELKLELSCETKEQNYENLIS